MGINTLPDIDISSSYTLLSTTTLSGASTTLSSIPGAYRNLEIIVRNYKPVSDERLVMRFNGDTGANYNIVTGNNESNIDTTLTFSVLGDGQDSGTATGLLQASILDYANTTTVKMMLSYSITNNGTTPTNYQMNRYANVYDQTGAITSITLFPQTVNFTSGTVYLYGVK